MKIFLAKQFFRVGDLEFNYNKIIEVYNKSLLEDCDLLVFSEMSITGFPIYEELLDENFIKKSDEYIEKIVDYTKGKKTRILLGCPYFMNSYTTKENIVNKARLFNSVVLINDGYIDGVSSKTNILKNNLFDEYKYFDKEIILKNITYENDNFDVLISDDITDNKNILFIKERDTEFVICLDTEISKNIESKKLQLIKIAKWTKKNIIYLNSFGYDFKNNYSFFGETFLVNSIGEIIYKNNIIAENTIKIETSVIDGKIQFQPLKVNSDESKNFIDIIVENYKNKNFIYEIKSDEKIKKSDNIELITFSKEKETKEIKFIDINDYIKQNSGLETDDHLKEIILNNIFKKFILIKV